MNKPFTLLVMLFILPSLLFAINLPKLNSLPSARATIYLDFDGYDVNSGVWNSGLPFTCEPAGMTNAEVTEVFNRVAEDFRPFNINITTDSTVYAAAPLVQRIRVVITPTSSWYSGVGGISYIDSFTWGDETPAFVFCDRLGPNNPKLVAECCAHESGHTLGLQHQSSYDSSCNITAIYNAGQGSGEIGWAPIMGNSYNRNMSSWNNGPTPAGCTVKQDNLSIIVSKNGFSYRTDDFSDDISSTPYPIDPANINVDGLISTTTDKDAFKFTITKHQNFHIDATPFNVGTDNSGANVDLRVQLFNASKKSLGIYDPSNTMSATIDTVLDAGNYYLLVDGSDNANATDYNSLGGYKLRGISAVVLPIQSIALTGKKDNNKHELNWNIITDEPLRSVTIEFSADGLTYNTIQSLPIAEKNYSYTPSINGNIYYRLKIISVSGQTYFSNVITLKNSEIIEKTFTISTLVYNDISVHATTKFIYQLTDMSGKIITTGKGKGGANTIGLNGLAKGMYLLQLIGNNERKIERIIKQ